VSTTVTSLASSRARWYAAVGEIEDLQRARVADQTLDVFRDELLGADREVHGNGVVAEEFRAPVIIAGADPRDLGGCPKQRPRDLAGDHVHFVAVGQCDDQVRAAAAGGLEHGGVGRVTRHGADVEAVLQVAQHVVARIHDRHVVGLLAGELLRRCRADLAGAENYDFQVRSLAGSPASVATPQILAQPACHHPSRGLCWPGPSLVRAAGTYALVC